jgi:hypothetical protein
MGAHLAFQKFFMHTLARFVDLLGPLSIFFNAHLITDFPASFFLNLTLR